ncbi:MAG TPA: hypothetical protein DCM87_09210 [Planctomycetes bacterium]|nr:hypothetical protein [Planctomycetota bacterium]
MREERPDLTLLTAVPFETALARRLGLRRIAPAPVPAYAGYVGNVLVALCQTGIRAKRLGDIERSPFLAPELGLVSLGLAGGLAPGLRGGAAIVPAGVADGAGRIPVHSFLRAAFAAAGVVVPSDLIAASDRLIATPEDKRALRDATGADAVDMESGVIGRWAAAHGIAFAVVRAVSDPATAVLPPGIAGGPRAGPHRALPRVLLLAIRALAARRALARVVRAGCARLAALPAE